MYLEEEQLHIFKIYKYALLHIGVDFSREDVQEAIRNCIDGLEDAFRATIAYWRTGKMEYPSAFLISALYNHWKPYSWNSTWMDDPNFISPAQKWWQQAEIQLGKNIRNSLIIDVVEDEQGYGYIVLANGKSIPLAKAQAWGWEKVLEYAQSERGVDNQMEI